MPLRCRQYGASFRALRINTIVWVRAFRKSLRYTLRSKEPLHPAFLSRIRQRIRAQNLERHTARTFSIIGHSSIEVESMFLHIPKTAGKSLRATLTGEAGFVDLPNILNGKLRMGGQVRLANVHYEVDWLLSNKVLDEASMRSSFVFTFVRNPFTRAISLYRYLTKLGAVPMYWSLHKFLKYVDHEKPRIGGFKMTRLSHAAPQVSWLEARNWPGVTRLCAMEDFDLELKYLSTVLNSSLNSLHLNSSATSAGTYALSEIEADLIRKIYRSDFEYLGYPIEVPPSLGSF